MLSDSIGRELVEAAQSREAVAGLTHCFYRYPARFSPEFSRAVIRLFTQPGDVVLDPFMGGGTAVVEATVLGRHAIGVDISSLAAFVTRVKTTVLTWEETEQIQGWAAGLPPQLNIRLKNASGDPQHQPYQKHLHSPETWRIRKSIEQILGMVEHLPNDRLKDFVRCAVLRTAQWALDNRREIPTTRAFRERFFSDLDEMLSGVTEYREALKSSWGESWETIRPTLVNRSVIGVEQAPELSTLPAPALILTSPPYPGVHILYHRWQVRGRKETPAPFWIAGENDGNGAAFYTFGHRRQLEHRGYFGRVLAAFQSLSRIASPQTVVVQTMAFSEPEWQLPRYLEVMEQAGFSELQIPGMSTEKDGRLWRSVPNRKWYADQRGDTAASKEVVLVHSLSARKPD